MKLLILAALVATCTCWSWDSFSSPQESEFVPSHNRFSSNSQYEYNYESQVLTGFPTFSKQYSGVKVKCTVKIDFNTNDECTLQMSEVKLFTLNGEILDSNVLPPTKQLSSDLFTPLTENSQLITEKLVLPLKFTYKEGKVEKLEITSEETNWSIDMKRSILSMLQVKLQAGNSKDTQMLKYNDLLKDNVTTFDVLESGLEGTCYSSLHSFAADVDTPKLYKVIKVRDLTRCLKLNVESKNVYPQRQSNCDCRSNMDNRNCQCAPVSHTSNSSKTRYDGAKTEYNLISEDGTTFIIRKAVQSVEYRVEIPHSPNKFQLTISNQTLIMTGQKSQSSSVSRGSYSWKAITEPWRMQILKDDEEKLMMSNDQITKNIERLIEEIVLVSTLSERFDDHPILFYQILDNLRLCQKDQITLLFNKFNDSKKNTKEWAVYLDALKAVNTTQADTFLMTKIVSGEIESFDAVSVFVQWASEKVPTKTTLDQMQNTVLTAIQSNAAKKVIYNHAMLCFGSMVRRYIHNEEIKIDQCALSTDKLYHQKQIDNCRSYEKYVEGRLSVAATDEDKIMVLKTIANLGSIKSLPMLQKKLVDTESTAVRVHAIKAFTNLGFQNKLKVVQSLLPIMLHHQEDSELRVAAFVMVMKCNPTASLMEVQKHLNDERDLEFKTFVVKYLKNKLEIEEPRCEQVQMRIRQTLKSIRGFHMSEETSDWQVKYGLKKYEDMIRISTIANTTSEIPRSSSIQQYTGINDELHHFCEIGYRAEGLKEMMADSSSPMTGRDMSIMSRLLKSSSREVNKPSVTMYVKVLGQEVSFAHFNVDMIKAMRKLVEVRGGAIEIPVSIFKTLLLKPRVERRLQPSGAYVINELVHLAVVDVEGTLKVETTDSNRLPIITFNSTKRMRLDVKTSHIQRINMGFVQTGIAGHIMGRGQSNAAKTLITYDLHEKRVIRNYTTPAARDFTILEVMANTDTGMLPTRLPSIVTTRQGCLKDLKVDESERKIISYDVTPLKSIELQGKLEGEVNMPELYSSVRDRFHILPTSLSTYKQHLKLTVTPASSDVKKVSLEASSTYFTPTEQNEVEMKKMLSESKDKEESDSIFSFLWKDAGETERESSSSMSSEEWLHPESLNSLCHCYAVSLATIGNDRTLNMSANWTTFYEHDKPDTSSTIRFVRPPIPSNEKENFEIVDEISSTLNSGSDELLRSHKIKYGPSSDLKQHTITISMKFRPSYKDNVCHERSVYGCKDEYGVIYPLWYNDTMHVEYTNNRIPEIVKEKLEHYLFNVAKSVTMFKIKDARKPANSMDIDFIVRPTKSQIDVIVRDEDFITNMTRVYAPVSTKIHTWIVNKHFQDSSSASDIGYLPIHRLNPFEKEQDFCVYEYPKTYTFDHKELLLPQTNCELVLAGDCDRQSGNLRVTVVPTSDLSAPKMLNVVLGNKKIQMNVTRSSLRHMIEVSVDGEFKNMRDIVRMPVMDQDKKIATIECLMDKCSVHSPTYGFYIHINMQRVTVEVDSEKSEYLCGLCAARTGLPKKPAISSSMEIAKDNLVTDEQCTIREPVSFMGLEGRCSKLNKWRVVKDINEKTGAMMRCVTEEAQPVCADMCMHTTKEMKYVAGRCISEAKARQIGLVPMVEGNEWIVENNPTVEKVKSMGVEKTLLVKVYKECR